MKVEVIDRLLGLAPGKTLEIGSFTYLDKNDKLTMFVPPILSFLGVKTLTGFVDLLEADFEKFIVSEVLIHVVDHETVHMQSLFSDGYGRRLTYLRADFLKPERAFKFNQFMGQEEFNIALQSLIVPSPEVTELLAISGNLTAEKSAQQEDDGVTQRVTVKAGIVKLDTVTPKPRVTLSPYRTFAEVVQPASDYIFRVKQSEAGNQCALFDADGGYWKHTAIASIKDWLSNRLKGSTVDGLPDIKVIA